MYTYITALGLSRVPGSAWKTEMLQTTMLRAMYDDFLEVYLTVHDSISDKEIYVDMNAYRTQYAVSLVTVSDWLVSMEGKPLTIVEDLPTSKMTSAVYQNAVLAGYNIQLAKIGFPYPEEMPVTELTDLILTRPKFPTDISKLHTHCLLSVNGYFHRSDTDGRAAYIVDGGITVSMKRCSHTGITSFLDMGGLTSYGLSDADIVPLTEGGLLKDGLIIRIPAESQGKSVLFSLGGYLVRPEPGVFYQNGENSWVFNIQGIPYLQRYMQSRKEIDLSSMNVEIPDTSDGIGAVTDSLYTDDAIRAYLKLSQSFITLVNTPDLYFNKINLRVSTIPGLITAYQEPQYPLILGYGLKVEFSKVKEAGWWALRVDNAFYDQYAFRNGSMQEQKVISDQILPYKPYLRTQGYLLEMRGNKTS